MLARFNGSSERGWMMKRTVSSRGPAAGLARPHAASAVARAPAAHAPMMSSHDVRLRAAGVAGASVAGASASSSSSRTSDASAIRRRQSLSRQRRSNLRTAAGVSVGKSVQSGSLLRTAAITCATSSPSKGRRAVNISSNTTPNAHRSLRLSITFPAACSGLMYAAVPMMTPRSVKAGLVIVGASASTAPSLAASESSAFASPKSRTFTVPSGLTLMFAGFRSRWTMPWLWAASSASAICFAIRSVRRVEPGRERSDRRASHPRPAP